jgi:hypothetical protein
VEDGGDDPPLAGDPDFKITSRTALILISHVPGVFPFKISIWLLIPSPGCWYAISWPYLLSVCEKIKELKNGPGSVRPGITASLNVPGPCAYRL